MRRYLSRAIRGLLQISKPYVLYRRLGGRIFKKPFLADARVIISIRTLVVFDEFLTTVRVTRVTRVPVSNEPAPRVRVGRRQKRRTHVGVPYITS